MLNNISGKVDFSALSTSLKNFGVCGCDLEGTFDANLKDFYYSVSLTNITVINDGLSRSEPKEEEEIQIVEVNMVHV